MEHEVLFFDVSERYSIKKLNHGHIHMHVSITQKTDLFYRHTEKLLSVKIKKTKTLLSVKTEKQRLCSVLKQKHKN